MKILVCTDGSTQSQKTVDEAAKIAGGCNADEVAIIYVYDHTPDFSFLRAKGDNVKREDMERFRMLEEQHKEGKKRILRDAIDRFQEKGLEATPIFKEGHPAEVITKVASEEGFDMIVMGSRGRGGLKKLLLGSVSSAVVQEAHCNVLTVK